MDFPSFLKLATEKKKAELLECENTIEKMLVDFKSEIFNPVKSLEDHLKMIEKFPNISIEKPNLTVKNGFSFAGEERIEYINFKNKFGKKLIPGRLINYKFVFVHSEHKEIMVS